MREKIVIVTNEERNYQVLLTQLKDNGYSTNKIIKYTSLMDMMYDKVEALVVLVCIDEPGEAFYDQFDACAGYLSKVAVIVISTTDDAGSIRQAMRRGIQDYLVAGAMNGHTLKMAILCAIERKQYAANDHNNINNGLFDKSPSPMWIYDPVSYQILAVNKIAIQQYGYTHSEFLEKTILDIRPAEDRVKVQRADKKKPANGYHDAGIWRHTRKDGTVFYAHVYSQPTYLNGNEDRLVIAVNVHEKVLTRLENKRLNHQLEKQQKQYEHILASVTEVVWSIRAHDYQLLYINEASADVFGYSPQELMADKALYVNLVHPEDKGKLVASFQDAARFGRSVYQFRIIHKNRQVKYISGTTVYRKGAGNDPDTYSGLSVDITQQVSIAEKLKEKADELENILETIKDAFYTVDNNWNFTYINKECELMYHVRREDLMGTCLWDLFPNSRSTRFYTEYHRAKAQGVSVHFNEFAPNAQRWLLINVYPHKDGLAIYHTDITEQKILEDKVRADQQNLSAIINNTKDIIWSIDEEYNIIMANDAYYERVKLIANKTDYNDVRDGDIDRNIVDEWRTYYKRAFDGEQFKIVYKSQIEGRVKYEQINFNPISNEHHKITGINFFSRDITDEKKLEELVITDRQNLFALINNTTDMIWSVDKNLCIISANNAYKDFMFKQCGVMPDTGSHVLGNTTDCELPKKWKQYYLKAFEGPFSITEEITDNVFLETFFNPIAGMDGDIVGVSCFSRDISLKRQQMMRIQMQNEQLKEIAWIQSHRVRGPVSTIMGLTQFFDPANSGDPLNGEIINGIIEAAHDLDAIIREVVKKTYDIVPEN